MLLDKLVGRQHDLGLTDREFADELGVPRSTWQLTRTGVKPIGHRVIVAVIRRFPELRQDAVSFLASMATDVAEDDTDVTESVVA